MKQLYHFCITCHDEVLFRDMLQERARHSRRKEETDITFSTEGTY